MPPNPSHLEAIDPVLEGMARAAGTDARKPGAPIFNPDAVLPILIHGDAAFSGPGRRGRDAQPAPARGLHDRRHDSHHREQPDRLHDRAARSRTARCTRAAWRAGFKIPIVHVNADDPEACIAAARLAFAYRTKFKRDVLIDLVGYRRYGHNEGDEPAFTQPVMYRKVAQQPTVRQLWAAGARGTRRHRARPRRRAC